LSQRTRQTQTTVLQLNFHQQDCPTSLSPTLNHQNATLPATQQQTSYIRVIQNVSTFNTSTMATSEQALMR